MTVLEFQNEYPEFLKAAQLVNKIHKGFKEIWIKFWLEFSWVQDIIILGKLSEQKIIDELLLKGIFVTTISQEDRLVEVFRKRCASNQFFLFSCSEIDDDFEHLGMGFSTITITIKFLSHPTNNNS